MSHPMIENYLPLVRNKATVAGQMGWVLIALLPGIGVSAWFYGLSSLVNLALCSATALLAEALFVWMRSRPILQTLSDGSALVTAWLISLSMLPISPWWVVVFITVFGLSIKHLYGGLGQNPV